ncbi:MULTISPECIES: hypothetical protein [Actinokineospora]|uniref:Uncharacterized protein n=1 Tax=Actinokineospora fastidiosa TaxID=1816 RepID=A0A918L708_9PSEU|nr:MULTISPECIES: hypothetical protein [Actinokineospora]UVS76817.1 hypothetical protein Actkin_00512 [Actinokineospora sp. UTMC 2448]GGS15578.1 hypothetical protein GCM10010171_04540 [Actinokineospora fastidiosa]
MTRPEPVRFLRTEPTMAFPQGRLLALRAARLHVLAPDGWDRLGRGRPAGAEWVTREEAEDWLEHEGWDIALLDAVPPAES